jgi:hypothetical protein
LKPFDLYRHFHGFCEMLDNTDLTIETRMDLGKEWLRSLPAAMLCAPYELSRNLIEAAMKGRLEEKEKNGRARTETTTKASERSLDAPIPPKTGAEPLREDATDGRGKTAVENLDRPKVSKAQRKTTRKT